MPANYCTKLNFNYDGLRSKLSVQVGLLENIALTHPEIMALRCDNDCDDCAYFQNICATNRLLRVLLWRPWLIPAHLDGPGGFFGASLSVPSQPFDVQPCPRHGASPSPTCNPPPRSPRLLVKFLLPPSSHCPLSWLKCANSRSTRARCILFGT